MARIAGVNLPFNKRVEIGLRYIFGIGPTRARKVCEELSIPASSRVRDLDDETVVKIRVLLEKRYLIEGDLRQEKYNTIKRLTDIGCYRGLRHRKRLPVRGQRTSSNARTARKGL